MVWKFVVYLCHEIIFTTTTSSAAGKPEGVCIVVSKGYSFSTMWLQRNLELLFFYRVVEKSGFSHLLWEQESAGSNPVHPTRRIYRFESGSLPSGLSDRLMAGRRRVTVFFITYDCLLLSKVIWQCFFPDRLTVGHQVLVLIILVQIQFRKQKLLTYKGGGG